MTVKYRVLKKVAIFLLLVAGFGIRLWKINTPLADWHSFRQADTAAVARNFVKHGYDLLHPRYDDLSNIASGKENPQGYRFVEFPLYNTAHALLFQGISAAKEGAISFEAAGRLTTIFSSLMSAIFLYLIVRELLGELMGFLTMGFFLFLPFNIYYSRVILPGPTMVMASLASIYFLTKTQSANWQTKSKVAWLLSLVLAMAAILIKPYAVFILLPSWLVYFFHFERGLRQTRATGQSVFIVLLYFGLYALISILPFVFWRLWMQQFPEGIPANQWLLNAEGIRFRPAWWRWLFAERLGKLILGYWGTILFGVGLTIRGVKKWSKEALFYSWLLGALIYLAIFASGNVRHDYYQILIIPALSVFLAKGALFLLKAPKKHFYKIINYFLLITCCLFMFGFSWYQIREYYKINHPEIIEAGKAANKILPKEAKVIAPYYGDTAFLYQTSHQGWPVVTLSFPEMIELGATHYVSVNFAQDTNYLMSQCSILEKTDKWVIIDLQKCSGLK